MATMRATFAQLEREMGQVRNRERYIELTGQGRWPGGRVPYGRRHDAESGQVVPETGGRADVLRQMTDKSISGQSHGQISEWLNQSGHRTARGLERVPATVRMVLRAQST